MRNVCFKKTTVAFIILLFILCTVSYSTGFKQDLKLLDFNEGNTLYVGGMGPGNYTSIQGAIDDADSGDTVFVFNDSSPYYEHLFLNKTISLVGEDRDSTVVDANHIGSVVRIYADGCLVSGFTLKNCQTPGQTHYFDVVKIFDSNNVVVSDNILSIGEMEYNHAVSAVWLYNSCYCNISGNVISELSWVQASSGVSFYSNSCFNTVSGNIISKYVDGVRVEWYGGCDGNMIIGNHISNSTDGIDLTGCNGTKIMDNIIEYNEDEGIKLDDAVHTVVSGNVIRYNGEGYEFDCGVTLLSEGCRYNTVSGNIISNNYPTGIQVIYAFNNVISGNNFIDNYGLGGTPEKWWGNAYFSLPFRLKSFIGANSWDNNFWSDYKGSGVKIIPGLIQLNLIIIFRNYNWFQIDRHPAQEPYDI
jgi:parallel beta-helix repeat protein